MITKILVALVAVALGALSQFEVEDDVLLVEKRAALPVNRIKAFQLLSDMKNYKHWFPGIEEFDPVDNMNVALGKLYIEQAQWFLYGTVEYTYVITGLESPRYISFVSNSWWLPRVEIILDRTPSEEDGKEGYPTTVTYRMHSRRRSYLVKYVLAPFAQFGHGYRIRQGLFNLKYVLQK